ncbi:MAG: lamin tail domain-containing protein [Akkermansiaceae bacterium]
MPVLLHAQVRFNEVMSAASDRELTYDANATPRVGTGPHWTETSYSDSHWKSGIAPLGTGTFTNGAVTFGTDIGTDLINITPTCYFRHKFTVNAAQAASTSMLRLVHRYNDGFIFYLNGVEVGREWAGPSKQYQYFDQVAVDPDLGNTTADTTHITTIINIGAANTKLLVGENTLAIHVLNRAATNTNFLCDPRLEILSSPSTTVLIPQNATWKYFPGVVEPSGNPYDPSLLSSQILSVPWGRAEFDASLWPTAVGPLSAGTPPAGVPVGTTVPDVINVAPSLYTRASFTPTSSQISSSTALRVMIDYDDAFVAYVNGKEVARGNMGNANSFTPNTALAFAARTPTGAATTAIIINPAKDLLVAGPNIFAVQYHNITQNDPDLYGSARLDFGTSTTLVPANTTWSYHIGNTEPVPDDSDSIEDLVSDPEASPDWIEIKNHSPSAVSLNRWSLTDDTSEPRKWLFPDVTIAPGGMMLIFCDGKDISSPTAPYQHTNFQLSRSGETVQLRNAHNELVDTITFGNGQSTQSYALTLPSTWSYHSKPTPLAENLAAGVSGNALTTAVAAKPTASHASGFYNTAITVSLTSSTPSSTIRFTTDGSEPSTTSTIYTGPISVTGDRSIRARSFAAGMTMSPVSTFTYLINKSTALKSLPAIFLTAHNTRSLYRPYGIFAIQDNNTTTNYTSSIWHAASLKTNYYNPILRGANIERPAHFHFRPVNPTSPAYSLDVGLRCAGSPYSRPRYVISDQSATTPGSISPWSSTATQKPQMNVFFHDDYGAEPYAYPFFPTGEALNHSSIRLRAGKNDISNPFIRDELMRRLHRDVGGATVRGINTTVWINAIYKGYFNLTERPREEFFQQFYGTDSEYDVWVINDNASGNSILLQELIGYVRSIFNPGNGDSSITLTEYQGVEQRLDIAGFIDYLIVQIYGATGDWPHNNYVMARERKDNAKWIFSLWDGEGAFGNFGNNVRTDTMANAVANSIPTSTPQTDAISLAIKILFTQLRSSDEFKLLFADRLQKHFFHNGALVDSKILARKNALRDEMLPLISSFADSPLNNWINGLGNTTRYNNSTNFPSRRNVLFDGYFDDVNGGSFVTGHFSNAGFWPSLRAPSPSVTPGNVATGTAVTLTNPNASSTILYTLDNSDPRLPGGTTSSRALTYTSGQQFTVNRPTRIKARVRTSANVWSPLLDAVYTPAAADPLLITEIHYNPASFLADDSSTLEFIELKNTSSSTLPLAGYVISGAIDYAFPANATLAANATWVIASNSAAFARRHPEATVNGTWSATQKLSNSGETIVLKNIADTTIATIAYDDNAPWPTSADGNGHSLVSINSTTPHNNNASSAWRASTNSGGTPHAAEPSTASPTVQITEILTRPPSGFEAFIELHNPTSTSANISGWWISDNPTVPRKFRIPNSTTIAAGGRMTFSLASLSAQNVTLSPTGGTIILRAADPSTGNLSGYADAALYPASPPDASLAPVSAPNPADESAWAPTLSITGALANNDFATGPAVITEFHYHPLDGDDEFIEIQNISGQALPLYHPTNQLFTWRFDGVTFNFPANTILPPQGLALIVPTTAVATFRSKYNIPNDVPIFGYTGALSNGGERLALQAPDANGAYYDVDSMTYDDEPAWPTAADGAGPSLERINAAGLASDPANWASALQTMGTPGYGRALGYQEWLTWFYGPATLTNPSFTHKLADNDADNIPNLLEMALGRDPRVTEFSPPLSAEKTMISGKNHMLLNFRHRSNAPHLSISPESSDTLDTGSWNSAGLMLHQQPVAHGDGTQTSTYLDTTPLSAKPKKFYRLSGTSSE